jgi:gamma-butyrobetaine dioxygenase
MDGPDGQAAGVSELTDAGPADAGPADAQPFAAPSVRELDPAWLRDNCQCSDCRDPVSGQRLVSITDQPDGVILASVTDTADGWYVRFEPDGHQAVVTRAWLESQLTPAADGRTEDAKQLWTAADFPAGPPAVSWADYLGSDATRLGCLRQLLSAGFMLLRGVPAEPGAVLTVAASMGYVRETNYGRLFDVRVEATPANLAFTGLPIGPHTDNPYRDPVPTLQLLHCLVSAADGGESGLLDGFRAAGMLRADDPAAFDCLTRTLVTFGYRDEAAELRATRPMIGVDAAGRIREVRYNSRSMQPIRPAAGSARGQAALGMREFYRAYRAFATTLLRPDLTIRFSLEPGDCVVFDNTRVLHSRTGFTATGHRHLQGCYADIDGAESTVAVLARRNAGVPDAGVPDAGVPDAALPGGPVSIDG